MLILLLIPISYFNSSLWALLVALILIYVKFLWGAPHTLIMLLTLEISAVLLLLILSLKLTFVSKSFMMIFLTLSVVEACLGLSLMIGISRTKGEVLLLNWMSNL